METEQPPKKRGRPKKGSPQANLRDQARDLAPKALEFLFETMEDTTAPLLLRVRAATTILDKALANAPAEQAPKQDGDAEIVALLKDKLL